MDYRIIAVDFDGTLCYSKWPELGEPNRPLIEYLRSQKDQGNKLTLGPVAPDKRSIRQSLGAGNTSWNSTP